MATRSLPLNGPLHTLADDAGLDLGGRYPGVAPVPGFGNAEDNGHHAGKARIVVKYLRWKRHLGRPAPYGDTN